MPKSKQVSVGIDAKLEKIQMIENHIEVLEEFEQRAKEEVILWKKRIKKAERDLFKARGIEVSECQ